jgi:hypothetical protein
MRGDDVRRHGVIRLRRRQIRRIKRLINHLKIAARPEGVHHRGTQVAGAGPHCNAHRRILSAGKCVDVLCNTPPGTVN